MVAIKMFSYNKIKIVYIIIFLFLLPIISSNFITMKYNGTGKEEYFINQIKERKCPNKIIIDGILISHSKCKYKFPNKIVTIKIKIETNISNFYLMFSDISNIIEIDLSKLNFSLIKNMSYMFDNCKSLIFANLSNIDISSEINMDYMFRNCLSLKKLDLTNVDISKINNNKNIFFNCINLNNNYLFDNNNQFIKRKRYLQQSDEITVENNFCNIFDFLNESRTCKINLETAYGEIHDAIYESSSEFINKTIVLDNEIFSIYFYDKMGTNEMIDLRRCENKLRSFYNIFADEKLLIYSHQLIQQGVFIPIISFSLFFNFDPQYFILLNLTVCKDEVIYYNIKVELNGNIDIYNFSSEYYSDSCSYISNLSLYKRKELFNLNNLSVCQKNCEFERYDLNTRIVTCSCKILDDFNYINKNEVWLPKFELKQSDKFKCLNITIEFCNINEIFNETKTCKINTETANKEIIEELQSKLFRVFLINDILKNKTKISTKEDNKIFSISYSQYEEVKELSECAEIIKKNENMSNDEDIIIYKNENIKYLFIKQIIDFKLFNDVIVFDTSLCNIKKNNISNNDDQEILLDELKNFILKDLSSFVNSSSVINGNNFTALVLSTDDMNIEDQLKNGVSAVDLGNCTEVLKEYYNISKEENLFILNIESNNDKNIEDNDSYNLGKKIQIEVYDNSGRQLNLSICKEDIKILMNLNNVKEIDIQTSQKFSEQGIDVFNASDNFFNDLCHNYENKDGIDIIIDDRRTDIYQNVTFCQDGCSYNGVNYELMVANCSCDSSIFQNEGNNNEEDEKEIVSFKTVTKSFISNLLDFNIEVIRCTNLIFDSHILSKNIGFYSMIGFNFFQFFFLCIFFIKRLKPIQNFMSNYIFSKNDAKILFPPKNIHSKKHKNVDKIKNEEKEIVHIIKKNNSRNDIKSKIRKKDNESKYDVSKIKLKINDKNDTKQLNNNNLENIPNKESKQNNKHSDISQIIIIPKNKPKQNNLIHKRNLEKISSNINVNQNKVRNSLLIKNKNIFSLNSKIKFQGVSLDTKNNNAKKILKPNNLYQKKKYNNINNAEIIKEKSAQKEQFDNNDNANLPKTDEELQDMDYEEAIIYDKRTYLKMYWSYLIDSQIILGTFFTDNKLNLFIIKLTFFISIFQISFFLNALFYTDEYISDAYHNNGVLDFFSGLPKSIYSFIATLLITNLLRMLSNSKSEFITLIRERSKEKDYLILIDAKLKKLKIKLIFYFIIIFIIGILFLYYVSSFCAVYRFSQKYLFYGCLQSFAMDFVIAFFTCLILALLRFIAIRKRIKCFLILSDIIGTFV